MTATGFILLVIGWVLTFPARAINPFPGVVNTFDVFVCCILLVGLALITMGCASYLWGHFP